MSSVLNLLKRDVYERLGNAIVVVLGLPYISLSFLYKPLVVLVYTGNGSFREVASFLL